MPGGGQGDIGEDHPALIALATLNAEAQLMDTPFQFADMPFPVAHYISTEWASQIAAAEDGNDQSTSEDATDQIDDFIVGGGARAAVENRTTVSFLLRLMGQSEEHLMWSVQQVTMLCQHAGVRGRLFKDELRKQGVIDRLVRAVAEAEQNRKACSRSLRLELFNALARSVYDHRPNALFAAERGLLRITTEALHCSDSLRDVEAAEYQLCCANNACGMILTGKHHLVLDSGILPILIRFAAGAAETTDAGRHIAIAALANLSNVEALCQDLIGGGAVEVLSAGLRVVENGTAEPTVGYMQALSAVVKTVGRGHLMGGWGSRFSVAHVNTAQRGDLTMQDPGEQLPDDSQVSPYVFYVNGRHSTGFFDQGTMRGLLVDRRSARWMLEYLRASCDGHPYPPSSNIYGTAWKVAQSVACMAHASAHNRQLLHQLGAWQCLVAALLRDLDREMRPYDEEERFLTEMHVVRAMRNMLRSPEDVIASIDAVRELQSPWSFFQSKLEAIACGCSRWSASRLATPSAGGGGHSNSISGGESSEGAHGLGAHGLCVVHTQSLRETAAEVLLIWGAAWEVERLIWLAVKKPAGRACPAGLDTEAQGCRRRRCSPLGLLTPSMVRLVMRFVVMHPGTPCATASEAVPQDPSLVPAAGVPPGSAGTDDGSRGSR